MSDLNLQYQADAVEPSGLPVWAIVLGVLVLGVIGVALKFGRRIAGNAAPPPQGLLSELCEAHKLDSLQGRLLNRIAHQARLTQPATMLLSINDYNTAIKKAERTTTLSPRDQETLDELRSILFAR